jgi:N-acetylglucosamine kinase-like BadF-type ATPase
MTSLLLGIDGGGTKTVALLANGDGVLLGRGQAASSNYHKVGAAAALAALDEVITAAFAAAQLPSAPAASICLGLSGVDRPEDLGVFRPWLAERHPNARSVIVNDAELVLAAGAPEGWGVAVICGTGSICVGRNRTGHSARADGWGNILGDEGSGFAIGLAALRAVMRAYDGRGPTTALTQSVLAAWALERPEQLVQRVYTEQATPMEIAALSVEVGQAAESGDSIALGIMAKAAHELANSVQAVIRRLEMAGEVPCGLAGGVLTKNQRMVDLFTDAAQELNLQLTPITLVHEPAQGALRLAQEALLSSE